MKAHAVLWYCGSFMEKAYGLSLWWTFGIGLGSSWKV
jgi:hypothetical protein